MKGCLSFCYQTGGEGANALVYTINEGLWESIKCF